MLSDESDTTTDDEDEGEDDGAPAHSPLVLSEDEWGNVEGHLKPKDAAAVASTSKHLNLVINTSILSRSNTHIPDRQRAVDALARAMYRGLAAGHEPAVARVLAAHVAVDVVDQVRTVAARMIFHVLHTDAMLIRPTHAVREAAREAMSACVGGAHAVASRIAEEQDPRVREYMARWYEE